jgi:hypothetical protein
LQLTAKLDQYQVLPSNTYNIDEKGFMIGILQTSKRYFTSSEFKNKRLKGAGQDGSREWVTIIASVCQAGEPLPPAIIYAAATNNHQDSWYEDLHTDQPIAHFITSPNGWTNDDIGYEWLTKVFDRHTKRKARNGRDYRLLFLDGHSSHINMRFIEFCDSNKILLMAYPPHSTHRLQPLDVSLFNPLANYYSQNLDDWLRKSHGICSMSKRHFWSLFKPAFDTAFSADNIASGWRKTGIYPLNSEVILSQVRVSESRPTSSAASSISAFSSSSWKRANRHYKATYGPALTREERKMHKTLDHLFAKSQYQELEIEHLKERLKLQEKQTKRQQTLFGELRSQTDTKAIFFSPGKVQQARGLLARRKRDKEEKADRKRHDKIVREERRLQKQLEQDRRREERATAKLDRERRLAQTRQAKEDMRLQKQAEKQLLSESKLTRTPQRRSPTKSARFKPYARPVSTAQIVEAASPGPSRSRPQRRLPERYCD